LLNSEEKDDVISSPAIKSESSLGQAVSNSNVNTTPTLTSSNVANLAPTATPEIDEDGYSIQPSKNSWDKEEIVQKSMILNHALLIFNFFKFHLYFRHVLLKF
jgi:hypothetical protein